MVIGPRLVLILRFCELTGYTRVAVQRKIDRRQWRLGQILRKAPDGHLFVDLEAFEKWVEASE